MDQARDRRGRARGGLLALGAGTASADEASTRASVRAGSAPTAEVRLCGDGVALSGLLGRCGGQAGSDSDGTTVQAGANHARVRVSGLGSARGSLETRPSRPRATVSGQATIMRPAGLAPSVAADVAADTSPRASVAAGVAMPSARNLDSAGQSATAKVAIMLAREGTADGADATATVDLADPPATADAAITVGHDAMATNADATVELGLVGPADPAEATVDANLAVGHDGSATDADAAVAVDLSGLADDAAGATVDATLAVGLPGLGDAASAGADAVVEVGLAGVGVPALDGVAPTLPTLPAPVGDLPLDGLLAAIDPPAPGVGGLVPSTPTTVCVGDCDADTGTGTGGTPPPTQPSPTPAPADGTGGQDTSTGGISAPDQAGLTGTGGMPAGAAGATLARLRSALGDAGGTLAFTGGATDLLAFMALGLLMAGALLLRAARPAPVAERR